MNFTDLEYCALNNEGDRSQITHRYQIPNFNFSFRKNFHIKNELGDDVFILRSKALLSTKLVLEDTNGTELLIIESDVLHLHSRYKISSLRPGQMNQQLAIVKQKSFWSSSKLDVESVYGRYSTKRTDKWGSAFIITKNGQEVATVNTKFFSQSAAMKVEIVGDEDQGFLLALALVLYDFNDNSAVYVAPTNFA